MRLYVCGSAGTYAGPRRACAGYLVEHDGYRLLLDCGNGVLTNLQLACDVSDVDAVLVSHLHPDHFADLYGLCYALRFHPSGERSVPVYAPAGAERQLGQLVDDPAAFARTLRFATVAAGDRLALGPLDVSLHPADHLVECVASRVEAGGAVVAYSGDSGPTPTLDAAAADADVFVCDATWLERQRPLPSGVHMTGAEAGQQAASAGARRLLVTHVLPTNDPGDVSAEAATAFDGEVLASHDRQELVL